MDDIKAKQQVIEKIKASTKILVTVSDSPSVDALSAALALTLILDKQQKYASAIFSGDTPPAIKFLEPEKTFDNTTDSLRDFIIALDKEKADHLRYKVEGDSVKIFITPYKTTITQEDLDFSQGDYNVELVIALGVDKKESLDNALDTHGQILHDATVITVTAGTQTSTLGGIDWNDPKASSLSEMIAGLAEALKEDKTKSLIDAPVATALLTGIVAETARFSNEHTTSAVMTVAAQLMVAGADQQLIATELTKSHEIGPGSEEKTSTPKAEATSTKDGLSIKHEGESLADLEKRVSPEKANEPTSAEEIAEPVVGSTTPSSAYALEDAAEPTLGGTLSATAEQAAEDARRDTENDQNKTILSHSYLGSADDGSNPVVTPGSVAATTTEEQPVTGSEMHSAYAFDEPVAEVTPTPEVVSAPAPAEEAPSVALGGERVIQPLSAPEAPVTSVVTPDPVQAAAALAAPVAPIAPTDLGLPMPPPLPDFSQAFPPAPVMPTTPTPQPEILGDILAPEAPALIPAPVAAPVEPLPAPAPVPPAPPANPAQFQIPGQQ